MFVVGITVLGAVNVTVDGIVVVCWYCGGTFCWFIGVVAISCFVVIAADLRLLLLLWYASKCPPH